MRRLRKQMRRQAVDNYLVRIHTALLDGSDARIAAAHLGVQGYAMQRQLYNLRLQYLTRLQREMVADLTAARESIAALVGQEQAVITARVNEDLLADFDLLLRDRRELFDYAANLRVMLADEYHVEDRAMATTSDPFTCSFQSSRRQGQSCGFVR